MNAEKIAYFPPIPPEKKSEEKQKNTRTTTTTTPWARARARESFERLLQYYCESFGRRQCPACIQRALLDALKAGMHAKTICLCIDAAQEAERPTWAYAHAVIMRCIEDGALTPNQFEARSARHRGRAGSSVQYAQRTYTEEELEKLVSSDLFDGI